MKITGKVTWNARGAQHNQATVQGVGAIAQMLAGESVLQITNCFLITNIDISSLNKTAAYIGWTDIEKYVVGERTYASTGTPVDSWGGMEVVASAATGTDNSATVKSTIQFPTGLPNRPVPGTPSIYMMVLVAGGNISANTGGYKPIGTERVMAVLDLRTNMVPLNPSVDNNFTWTIYITPEVD